MNVLRPLSLAVRGFNTASNVYLAGQIGWWAYKQVRQMQKEKLRASELKERFVMEYVAEFGEEPSPELISRALNAYDAVEKPLQHRFKKVLGV